MLKKAAGDTSGADYEEIVYEGYVFVLYYNIDYSILNIVQYKQSENILWKK